MKKQNFLSLVSIILLVIVVIESMFILFMYVNIEDSKEWFREEINSISITIVGYEKGSRNIYSNNREVSISLFDNSSKPKCNYSFDTIIHSDKNRLDSTNYKIEQYSDHIIVVLMDDNSNDLFRYRYDFIKREHQNIEASGNE